MYIYVHISCHYIEINKTWNRTRHIFQQHHDFRREFFFCRICLRYSVGYVVSCEDFVLKIRFIFVHYVYYIKPCYQFNCFQPGFWVCLHFEPCTETLGAVIDFEDPLYFFPFFLLGVIELKEKYFYYIELFV